MDTFCEQLITIKKTTADWFAILGYFALATVLSFIALTFFPLLMMISVVLSFGFLYAAYRLAVRHNVEYEYIITNNLLDIDKITNKSTRKRLLSVELPTASRLEKYNPALLTNIDLKKVVFACNKDDASYLLVCEKEGKGAQYLVFAPNEKMQSAMVKSLPKFIANSAFK